MKGALETKRIFPYLAWGMIGCFVLSIFLLMGALNEQTKEMTTRNEATIEALLNEDFSKAN